MPARPTHGGGDDPASGAAQRRAPAPVPVTAHVVLHGRTARAVLAGGEGRVLAALSASVYLEGGGGVCCLGPPSLGAGPLNVVCDALALPGELAAGRRWRLRDAWLRFENGPALHLPPGQAAWWPRPPRFGATSLALKHALKLPGSQQNICSPRHLRQEKSPAKCEHLMPPPIHERAGVFLDR